MIIKVCGMREPENIRAIENTGADWIGFICYERSPRFVADTPAYLPRHAKRVGVFVNAGFDTITARAEALRLDYVQLHGTESPELCLELRCHGFHLIKAFAPRTPADLEQTIPYLPLCDYLLFDTPSAGRQGVRLVLASLLSRRRAVSTERRHLPRKPRSIAAFPSPSVGRHRPEQRLRNRSRRKGCRKAEGIYRENKQCINEQCDNEQCDNEQCDNEQCDNKQCINEQCDNEQ